MSANSKIEWTDHTFNPWIGCTKVSPACDNCYAAVSTPSRTLGVVWGAGQPRRRTSPGNWAMPLRWDAQATAFAAQSGRRQRVFCASLADVFDNEVPDEWRADLFAIIAATPSLDWLLLTKRIGNVSKMLGDYKTLPLLPNIWLGATIANQEEADRDIPKLLAVPARVRFLSVEPLLGPVDLTPHLWGRPKPCDDCPKDADCECGYTRRGVVFNDPALHWVIVGGESGTNARPMHPDWARNLRDQCAAAGVPFLFKQWGEWAPHRAGAGGDEGGDLRRGHVRYLEGDGREPDGHFRKGDAAVARVGKKAAGRLLDSVQHDGYPA